MDNKIRKILESLIKPCHKIDFKKRYEYYEDDDNNIFETSCYIFDEAWKRDNYGREFVFQIINYSELSLPKEITKLQLYYHLDNSTMNLIITDKKENYIKAEKFQNINGVLFFEPSYNLPDWKTLQDLYNNYFRIISDNINKENPGLEEYEFYEKYNEFVNEILGHENHYSFIG
jgi:hypothetical protein